MNFLRGGGESNYTKIRNEYFVEGRKRGPRNRCRDKGVAILGGNLINFKANISERSRKFFVFFFFFKY